MPYHIKKAFKVLLFYNNNNYPKTMAQLLLIYPTSARTILNGLTKSKVISEEEEIEIIRTVIKLKRELFSVSSPTV